jgi:hypothetical protein
VKSEWVGFEPTNIKKAHRQNRGDGLFLLNKRKEEKSIGEKKIKTGTSIYLAISHKYSYRLFFY